ncbi:hypothetical protein [Acinetobacter bereziniae]|uniref:hypothetical protein n=1 Tax=Acinetobacter bereziniae TaxID=106648 RepID=UPI00124FDF80|nr:hypothetical protein [Acinetobacter bereziniae]
MKKISFVVFILFQLIFAGNAIASTYTGKVSAISVRDEDGLVWISIQGERTGNRPTCATHWYMVIKNENSSAGKRQLAMLMMAKATNRPVVIDGAGTCSRWSNGEDISTISM